MRHKVSGEDVLLVERESPGTETAYNWSQAARQSCHESQWARRLLDEVDSEAAMQAQVTASVLWGTCATTRHVGACAGPGGRIQFLG